jgi:hypothetical protein
MSYALTAYVLRPLETLAQVAQRLTGEVQADEEYDGLPLTDETKAAIREECTRHGMDREESPSGEGFTKGPLQIHVYDTQVAITVPYWASAAPFLKEGLDIAKVLTERTPLRFWDPQEEAWVDRDSKTRTFTKTADLVKRGFARRKPWWKFW